VALETAVPKVHDFKSLLDLLHDELKWWVCRLWYLEWGTARAPKKFSRPTFPELHEAKEKLIAVRTPGATPKVVYDDDRLHFDASSVGFVPWHLLKGVVNKSIKSYAVAVVTSPLSQPSHSRG